LATPEKQKKSGIIDQILTQRAVLDSIDIKKVANNHATAILERCQKAKKLSFFFLLFLTDKTLQ